MESDDSGRFWLQDGHRNRERQTQRSTGVGGQDGLDSPNEERHDCLRLDGSRNWGLILVIPGLSRPPSSGSLIIRADDRTSTSPLAPTQSFRLSRLFPFGYRSRTLPLSFNIAAAFHLVQVSIVCFSGMN